MVDFQFPDGIENIAAFVSAWRRNKALTYSGKGWAEEPVEWWDQVYLYLALEAQVERKTEGIKDASGNRYVDLDLDE